MFDKKDKEGAPVTQTTEKVETVATETQQTQEQPKIKAQPSTQQKAKNPSTPEERIEMARIISNGVIVVGIVAAASAIAIQIVKGVGSAASALR